MQPGLLCPLGLESRGPWEPLSYGIPSLLSVFAVIALCLLRWVKYSGNYDTCRYGSDENVSMFRGVALVFTYS